MSVREIIARIQRNQDQFLSKVRFILFYIWYRQC